MSEEPIHCVNCKQDLTYTGNCIDYCVVLKNHKIPSLKGAVTMMGKIPALKKDAYFCNVMCLKKEMEDYMEDSKDE